MEQRKIDNEKLNAVLDDNLEERTDQDEKWLIQYNKKTHLDTNCHVVLFGGVEQRAYDQELHEAIVMPQGVIDEFTFYYLFCSINNIVAKEPIAATQLLVLSKIMSRPLNFSLPIDSKDGKLTDIAKELSTPESTRTPNAIYQSVKRLRDKGYLIEIEDRLIVPNARFQRVRNVVKKQLEKKGYATFDYLFKCYVSNKSIDESTTTTNT
jgi:hypothetical protein